MSVEERIDDLIKAGWYVLDSDFDTAALQHWRLKAFHCCDALLGSDHVTTQYFGYRASLEPCIPLLERLGLGRQK
ncbi:MAG: hypothetical protein AB7V04_07630 [Desulfomonilaceae bacterium]